MASALKPRAERRTIGAFARSRSAAAAAGAVFVFTVLGATTAFANHDANTITLV